MKNKIKTNNCYYEHCKLKFSKFKENIMLTDLRLAYEK